MKSFDMKAALQRFSPAAAFTGACIYAGSSLALDITPTGPIGTALTGAKDDAVGVGGMVIGLVAGIIVIGIVIGLLRKA